jgi:hypothetical protein
VASLFAPFMLPVARPVLHYVLDRPGASERTLALRASAYSMPIVGGNQRDIQLQWEAPDPIAYDVLTRTVTATPATAAAISPNGDLPASPLFRITGPITAPVVTLTPTSGPAWTLAFLPTFTVAAGHHVDIDTDDRTIYYDSNPAQSRLASLDWSQSSWQWVANGQATLMALSGSGTTGATQVVATWNDGYLT